MLRKRYLYSSAPVPRTTRYRKKLKDRRQNKAASSRKETEEVPTALEVATNNESTTPVTSNSVDSEAQVDDMQTDVLNADLSEHLSENSSLDGTSSARGALEKMDSGIADDCSEDEGLTDQNEFSIISEASENEEHAVDVELRVPICEEDEIHPPFLSCDSDDELTNEPWLSQPLCESTTTTEGDAMLMCLALGLRHNLSWAAMVDILDMINHLFDRPVLKATKYFFLKHMEGGKENTTFHIYCPYCERYLGQKQDASDNLSLVCQCGTKIENVNQATSYFLSIGIGKQIQEYLSDKNFVNGLNYRFTREKMKENAYEDIYDGELYRSLSGPGQILWNKYNFSYTFNLDGFPVGGKSGKQTCWPIYLRINELPPELRSKYMILGGIYVGKEDPNMKIFLYPFVEEANFLSEVGVNWSLNGREINSKIIPLCACVDTPARSKILNMTQFNGYYGCTLCYCKGESIGRTVFYTLPPRDLQERTHEEIVLDAARAEYNKKNIRDRKKTRVRGVKGVTPLHNMNYLDLIRGVRPEIMHSTLLGNGDHLTFIFLGWVGQPFYIGCDIRKNAVSERLLSIRPPSSISRPPRSLKHANLWKANEWRSWVLFYGVVCLRGIIPEEHVIHFSLLSTALHIILQKSITSDDLEKLELILTRYVWQYQQYFGKTAMVYNIHLMFHTRRNIELLGPAWTNTAFAFEAANKTLSQIRKSTSNIAKEIARKFLTYKSFPTLTAKYATSQNAVRFCEKICGRSLKSFQRVDKVVLLGTGRDTVLNPEEFQALQNHMFSQQRELLCFDKFIKDGVKYCTNSYSRSTKHDDSFICIRGETRGKIEKICSIMEESKQSIVIFVREICLDERNLFIDELGQYSPIKRMLCDGNLLAIRPGDISTQCVAMFLDNGNFICDMPYGCYNES